MTDLSKRRKSGPSGPSGRARPPSSAQIAVVRALVNKVDPFGVVGGSALARLVGVESSRVSSILNGKRGVRPETLDDWARRVGEAEQKRERAPVKYQRKRVQTSDYPAALEAAFACVEQEQNIEQMRERLNQTACALSDMINKATNLRRQRAVVAEMKTDERVAALVEWVRVRAETWELDCSSFTSDLEAMGGASDPVGARLAVADYYVKRCDWRALLAELEEYADGLLATYNRRLMDEVVARTMAMTPPSTEERARNLDKVRADAIKYIRGLYADTYTQYEVDNVVHTIESETDPEKFIKQLTEAMRALAAFRKSYDAMEQELDRAIHAPENQRVAGILEWVTQQADFWCMGRLEDMLRMAPDNPEGRMMQVNALLEKASWVSMAGNIRKACYDAIREHDARIEQEAVERTMRMLGTLDAKAPPKE